MPSTLSLDVVSESEDTLSWRRGGVHEGGSWSFSTRSTLTPTRAAIAALDLTHRAGRCSHFVIAPTSLTRRFSFLPPRRPVACGAKFSRECLAGSSCVRRNGGAFDTFGPSEAAFSSPLNSPKLERASGVLPCWSCSSRTAASQPRKLSIRTPWGTASTALDSQQMMGGAYFRSLPWIWTSLSPRRLPAMQCDMHVQCSLHI